MKKYNLLIPMAGRGQRFVDAGYKVPKQFIHVGSEQLLDISLNCFDLTECNLIFVVRDDQISNYNVDQILKYKYGNDITIVTTDGLTEGSTCSCLLAGDHIDNDIPLFIHTLDIEFGPKISPAVLTDTDSDGVLLTFKSNSANYSYVEMDDNGQVTKTAEKKVISDKACVGIYYFRTGALFCSNARDMIAKDMRTNNEFYITPLYNLLVEKGLKITTLDVEKMHIFGTPKEYEFYKNNVVKRFGVKPIALCSDHSGFKAKKKFKTVLTNQNIPFIDFGTHVKEDSDYKYFIEQAVESKNDGTCDFILGFCRTGQGVNMCANKFTNVRSALIYDEMSAEMAIRHNCANFFAVPERHCQTLDYVERLVEIFKKHTFDGGRHQMRVQDLER